MASFGRNCLQDNGVCMSRIDIVGQNGNDGLHYELDDGPLTKEQYDLIKKVANVEEIEMLDKLLEKYNNSIKNDGFKKNRIPNIKDDRDEIYNAWRKSWGYGIPSKQGEEVFNAHGRGFQEGWRAAEEWLKNK